MIYYHSTFKNNQNQPIEVGIYVPSQTSDDIEITLSDEPVIITQESDGLFSPIKSCSCTINIMTDEALWDLYTTDPQSIMVYVTNLSGNSTVLFKGYATPCQYGQDWTTIDVLSLECVDMLSSLKSIPYRIFGTIPCYMSVDKIISHLLALQIGDNYDQLYHSFTWYWPYYNFQTANGQQFSSTSDFLSNIKLNEANFFDDDDEHTPWTCYEVLEEICKFLCVSAVPYQGSVYFIDYLYAAGTGSGFGTYKFWEYTLDMDVQLVDKSKSINLHKNDYAGGTTEIGTDDFYNIINIDANRYDLDELTTDIYDESNHISITKEKNFSGVGGTWTLQSINFWGNVTVLKQFRTYMQYCRLDPNSGWRHIWWVPTSLTEFGTYYNTAMNGYSNYITLPQNKYINTIGAVILHYASVEEPNVPNKLDWKKVIMFNCLTDTIKPHPDNGKLNRGQLLVQDIYDRIFEKPVLEYKMPHEMNFSPKEGKSWIVINNELWYQQNRPGLHNEWTSANIDVELTITDTTNHKQLMVPIEDVTSGKGYTARQFYYANGGQLDKAIYAANVRRWEMCQYKLQIGDKYWNGSNWTTTESTFYIKYSGEASDSVSNYNFSYLSWMKVLGNTSYEDKVGTDGYCIPIEPSDCVCGQFIFTIYTPRLLPHGDWEYNYIADEVLEWYERGPVVYMKDLKVDYVYTDTKEWWLEQSDDKEDIKYSNDTKDTYKYEKDIECKINTWQEEKPIAKSFPIIDLTEETNVLEFLNTVSDPAYYPDTSRPQEDNIISHQLRHYDAPRKTAKIHRHVPLAPWYKCTFGNTANISGTFVVDKQEFDVRACNCTTDLIEFGDTTQYGGMG